MKEVEKVTGNLLVGIALIIIIVAVGILLYILVFGEPETKEKIKGFVTMRKLNKNSSQKDLKK